MAGRRRKSKKQAPATIYFGQAINEEGKKQLCVWAECHYSAQRVGPIWSHSDQAVRRALATLTKMCECPAFFHKPRGYEGHRVFNKPGSPT